MGETSYLPTVDFGRPVRLDAAYLDSLLSDRLQTFLQQPVEREQMKKLLATGRTDLLTNFVSKKNRKFKAFLVKTPQNKVGFEFLPRAEKPGKAAKTPAAAAAPETPVPKDKPAKKLAARKKKSA